MDKKFTVSLLGRFLIIAAIVYGASLLVIRGVNLSIKSFEDKVFDSINKTSLNVSREDFSYNIFRLGYSELIKVEHPKIKAPIYFSHRVNRPYLWFGEESLTGEISFKDGNLNSANEALTGKSITNWKFNSKNKISFSSNISDLKLKIGRETISVKDANIIFDEESNDLGRSINFDFSNFEKKVKNTSTLTIESGNLALNSSTLLSRFIDVFSDQDKINDLKFNGIHFNSLLTDNNIFLKELSFQSKTSLENKNYVSLLSFVGKDFSTDYEEISSVMNSPDENIDMEGFLSIKDIDMVLFDKYLDSFSEDDSTRDALFFNVLDNGFKSKGLIVFGDLFSVKSEIILSPKSEHGKIFNKALSLASKVNTNIDKKSEYLASMSSEYSILLSDRVLNISNPLISRMISKAISDGYLERNQDKLKSHIEFSKGLVRANGEIVH